MLPIRIEGATRVLAKEQEEYAQLAIRDHKVEFNGKTFAVMTSLWEFTPSELSVAIRDGSYVALWITGVTQPEYAALKLDDEQRRQIKLGGRLLLSIFGSIHPPVGISFGVDVNLSESNKIVRHGMFFVMCGVKPLDPESF